MSKRKIFVVLTLAAFAGLLYARGQTVADYAVRVSAAVQVQPAQVQLSWPADPQATGYTVYRKTRDASSWGQGTSLPASATAYVDSSVTAGGAYEYRVSKAASASGSPYTGEGYLYAGIQAPLTESRGKVILLVDATFSSSLARELDRLQQDLVGDGWTVLRHDVARNGSVPDTKALINADYQADPANVKAVFLLGHVPVPYSGNFAPDGHAEHVGAWPADVYYGDMDGVWTDSQVNVTTAYDSRNWNVPADGKFDQSTLPSDVELQVGRVDMANLPAFPQNETELLRQYLNKDHNFRFKFIEVQPRGLIDDVFGAIYGESFAASGWRNFAAFFGATNTVAGDWFSNLKNQSYLWGYGCGPGTGSSAVGVGSTWGFATNQAPVVFTMLFGSWFGDWDSQDNFLRAPLASSTSALTCAWAGRPQWLFHHMALGETIGFGTRLTQNNSSTYVGGTRTRGVHIALMGDPTLRMHPVAPPRDLVVTANGSGGMTLSWSPSRDNVLGYHVYRASSAAGPFMRLTGTLLTGTTFTDSLASSNVYMVRAVKLEVAGSGSYYNASQGVFQSAGGTLGVPVTVLLQPTNNAAFDAPAAIPLMASTFDPANQITNVEFYANGVRVGRVDNPAQTFAWSNNVPGSYSLVARANDLSGTSTDSSPVNIHTTATSPTLALAAAGPGSYALTGIGVPGKVYQIQAWDGTASSTWVAIGSATADASGAFRFVDVSALSQRFYRTVSP